MDFLTSTWFSWVVIVLIALPILVRIIDSAQDDGDVGWYVLKQIGIFVITMLLMPVIIIYGLYEENKTARGKKKIKEPGIKH